MTEHDLVLRGVEYYYNRGWRVFCEVNYAGAYLCDMILIRGDSIVAIEYKLRDWKKVIKQAMLLQLVTLSSYVCMPKIYEKALTECKELGIGYIVLKDTTATPVLVLRPRYTKDVDRAFSCVANKHYRDQVQRNINTFLTHPYWAEKSAAWQVPERHYPPRCYPLANQP